MAMTELKKTPTTTTTTTLFELKETIESIAQSMDEEKKSNRQYGLRACLERNGAAFERRQQWA